MRITSGMLCGRKIKAPPGFVRPTQDRVRKALFSMLGEKVIGARVIDLFAGSGSLGLEAWSRGAHYVCWVEKDRRVFRVLRDNASSLCTGSERLTKWVWSDVFKYLDYEGKEKAFDLVFADPPYGRPGQPRLQRKTLHALERSPIVQNSTWVVFEQGIGEPITEAQSWQLQKNKAYGDTRILIWERNVT